MSDHDAVPDSDEDIGLGEKLRRSTGGSGAGDSPAPGGAVVGGVAPTGGDLGGGGDLAPEEDSDDSRPVAGG